MVSAREIRIHEICSCKKLPYSRERKVGQKVIMRFWCSSAITLIVVTLWCYTVTVFVSTIHDCLVCATKVEWILFHMLVIFTR